MKRSWMNSLQGYMMSYLRIMTVIGAETAVRCIMEAFWKQILKKMPYIWEYLPKNLWNNICKEKMVRIIIRQNISHVIFYKRMVIVN